jgi:hypothetical protein
MEQIKMNEIEYRQGVMNPASVKGVWWTWRKKAAKHVIDNPENFSEVVLNDAHSYLKYTALRAGDTSEERTAFIAERLEITLEHGLALVYETVNDWLYDFWPDWPWEEEEFENVKEAFLKREDVPGILKRFQEKFGIDLMATGEVEQ